MGRGGHGYFIARLTSSVRMTPSFSSSNPETSCTANMRHASLISDSSWAEMSFSCASLLRRGLAGGWLVDGGAGWRFRGGWRIVVSCDSPRCAETWVDSLTYHCLCEQSMGDLTCYWYDVQ